MKWILSQQHTQTKRVELHIHLDGSVSPETLLDVAKLRNMTLPLVGRPKTVDDILRLMLSKAPWERFDGRLHYYVYFHYLLLPPFF